MKARAILSLSLAGTALIGSIVPALAYWQFRWQDPPGAVHTSVYFTTERDCQAAIKNKEAELEKRYPNPDRYPLTGSCEEHR